jgi:preprotein translocase subunit SecG
MIETLVLFGHLIVAGLIIALVLLQRGKGAEAGTGFGAGASGTVFGSRGSASFFSRATAVLATLFFATSLALAYFSTQSTGPVSVMDESLMDTTRELVVPPPGEEPSIDVEEQPLEDDLENALPDLSDDGGDAE